MHRSWPPVPAIYNSSIIASGEVSLAAQVSINEVTAFAAPGYGYNTVVLSAVFGDFLYGVSQMFYVCFRRRGALVNASPLRPSNNQNLTSAATTTVN